MKDIFGNQIDYPKFKQNALRKRNLSTAEKHWAWDNKSHACNICGKRVTKITEAEFDHTRAYSKKGATNLGNVKIVHRSCNRLKGKKSLSETKKQLGIKTKTKKRKASSVKNKRTDSRKEYWFNPLTGRKEEFRPLRFI